MNALGMPDVTDAHRRAAWALMAWHGWSYDASRADAVRRQILEARAKQLRTREWHAGVMTSTVNIKRVVLGPDGQPLRWLTQRAPGPLVAADLFPQT